MEIFLKLVLTISLALFLLIIIDDLVRLITQKRTGELFYPLCVIISGAWVMYTIWIF